MKNIIEYLNHLATELDPEITVLQDNDFACDMDLKEVYIPQIQDEKEAQCFMISVQDMAKNQDLVNAVSPLMWSFLHELGHIFSKQGFLLNKILRKITNVDALPYPVRCNLYYSLKEEQNATWWAIDYVNRNFEKVLNQDLQLQELCYQYYDSLNLEAD